MLAHQCYYYIIFYCTPVAWSRWLNTVRESEVDRSRFIYHYGIGSDVTIIGAEERRKRIKKT